MSSGAVGIWSHCRCRNERCRTTSLAFKGREGRLGGFRSPVAAAVMYDLHVLDPIVRVQRKGCHKKGHNPIEVVASLGSKSILARSSDLAQVYRDRPSYAKAHSATRCSSSSLVENHRLLLNRNYAEEIVERHSAAA